MDAYCEEDGCVWHVFALGNSVIERPQLARKAEHQRFEEPVGALQHAEFDHKMPEGDTRSDMVLHCNLNCRARFLSTSSPALPLSQGCVELDYLVEVSIDASSINIAS